MRVAPIPAYSWQGRPRLAALVAAAMAVLLAGCVVAPGPGYYYPERSYYGGGYYYPRSYYGGYYDRDDYRRGYSYWR